MSIGVFNITLIENTVLMARWWS